MERVDYKIVLEGVDALDLPASILRDLLQVLVEGAQRAARLALEGRSTARGMPPAWIAAASDVRIGSYRQGSLDLAVSAPPLVEVAAALLAQQDFFGEKPAAEMTAVDLLLQAWDDAASGKRESDRLDSGMLELLASGASLFNKGGTRLSIARKGHSAFVVDASTSHKVRLLSDATPSPRITRIAAVLDSLTMSTRSFALRLENGRAVRGFATGIEIDELKPLLGTEVVAEGTVSFRPSGDALRIDADYVAGAQASDVVWKRLPRIESALGRSSPSTAAELGALFGQWPGNETDEEIVRKLAELS